MSPPRASSSTLAPIPTFDRDIRAMPAQELLRHFGATSSGKLVASRLIRALAWQAWSRIQAGQEPGIDGNVRTFWYRFVKPALMRVPSADRNCLAADKATSRVLCELIEEERRFDYKDFGFNDENWRNRAIGLQRPHVLLFAEKTAHVRVLARLHRRLGVSFVALGGSPGACTSAYTADQLLEALPRDAGDTAPDVHLIGLVDHDPAGAIVASSFADQLRNFGVSASSLQTVVRPQDYTPEQLEMARLPLKDSPRTRAWMEDGGGVDGRPYGLSVESLPTERVEALLEEMVLSVAPEPLPVAMPEGRSAEDLRGEDVVVIGSDDLSPSSLVWVAEGKTVAVVEGGRVVAMLSR